MATGHWLTNKGKLLLLQGAWDDNTATSIKIGLCKVQAAAHDTAIEVADLNTVTDLVGGGSTECDFTNYPAIATRTALTRTNASEDDANDRVNLDASDVTWTSAGGATNNTVVGAFFLDATVDTNDTTRLLISTDWFAASITTNGGNLTYAIADLYRAS
jgi:hypothetical protein